MNNYAIIDSATLVINVVVWDGLPGWTPPDDCSAVGIPKDSSAGIGWTYINGRFIAPPELKPNLEG